jgi:hypothetical protein
LQSIALLKLYTVLATMPLLALCSLSGISRLRLQRKWTMMV